MINNFLEKILTTPFGAGFHYTQTRSLMLQAPTPGAKRITVPLELQEHAFKSNCISYIASNSAQEI